tara:strand:+ start:842 stop:1294 length:453 start_codon:yes stop_codon:yes gene_type:complete
LRTLFLLVLFFPVFEILILFFSISFYGWLLTFLEVFITFVLGFYLFKKNKSLFFDYISYPSKFFKFSSHSFSNNKKSFLAMIGSVLLILPGYISDIFGFFFIFKFTQNILLRILLMIAKPVNNSSVFEEHKSEIVEGEFFDLDKEDRINK